MPNPSTLTALSSPEADTSASLAIGESSELDVLTCGARESLGKPVMPASFDSSTVSALSMSVPRVYVSVTLAEPVDEDDEISSISDKLPSSCSSRLTISLSTSTGAAPGHETRT